MTALERPTLTLSPEELADLTRYKRAGDQLAELHRRGFHRAIISRGAVLLERAHYEAVCCGAVQAARPRVKPPVLHQQRRAA